ncbi:MAG: BTAD domain-containing putative transcriptional regulator, partial [bacterium]
MSPKKVLIIDQDFSTAHDFESEPNINFSVLAVDVGKRGLRIVRMGSVDAVFIADCLPQMHWLEVLKGIKRERPSLPVFIIASDSSEDAILSAFRAGATDYFKKPINVHEIRRRVEREIADLDTPHFAESSHTFPKEKAMARLRRKWLLPKWFSALGAIPEMPTKEVQDSKFTKEVRSVDGILPTLRVTFFGEFEVAVNDCKIKDWPSRKGKTLFAYMAYHPRRIYRDILMDQFWPDSLPDSARNCLNVTLHGLRHLFQQMDPSTEYIQFREECYFINPEIELYSDVAEFQHYWRLAQSTERNKGIEEALGEYELAAALYKGDFLEDEIYESWTHLERENLKETYLLILDRLSKHYSLDGKPMTAISLCKTILTNDPGREDIHARLMKCYCKVGQRDKALKQFRKCSEVLL